MAWVGAEPSKWKIPATRNAAEYSFQWQRVGKFSSTRDILADGERHTQPSKRHLPSSLPSSMARQARGSPCFAFRFEVLRPALTDKLRAAIGGQRHLRRA
jgi:hypothetical protein